jgi:hypothetical protein
MNTTWCRPLTESSSRGVCRSVGERVSWVARDAHVGPRVLGSNWRKATVGLTRYTERRHSLSLLRIYWLLNLSGIPRDLWSTKDHYHVNNSFLVNPCTEPDESNQNINVHTIADTTKP